MFASLGQVIYRLCIVVAAVCIAAGVYEVGFTGTWSEWLDWLMPAGAALLVGRAALFVFAGR